MDKRLKNGIVVVFISNIINVFFSLITNFILPKHLSVESYAAIKTFQLYVSYVGLLHFGYVDGIYLKYGGKNLNDTLDLEFASNLSTIRVFQLLITGIIAIGALLFDQWIVFFFALSIIPQNVSNYFKFLYQATGEFKIYSQFVNLSTIIVFLSNIILLFLSKTDNSFIFIGTYVFVYYFVWFLLELHFRKTHRLPKAPCFSFSELKTSVHDGILLTVGNLASMLLTSMDRWFVKILLLTVDFAHYSFAVSLENFLNIVVTPVSTTLYNYFCREKNAASQKKVLGFVVLFATVLPATAFPIRFIIEVYLNEYYEAILVIFLLFAAQIFYIVIRCVFVNLYKVKRLQKRYFVKLTMVLFAGFLFNALFYEIIPVKESFAVGTMLSAVLWLLITLPDFREMNIGWKTTTYLFCQLGLFLFCGVHFNAVQGFAMYFLSTLVMMNLLMRPELIGVVSGIRHALRRSSHTGLE